MIWAVGHGRDAVGKTPARRMTFAAPHYAQLTARALAADNVIPDIRGAAESSHHEQTALLLRRQRAAELPQSGRCCNCPPYN
jgi:hypothetical protein